MIQRQCLHFCFTCVRASSRSDTAGRAWKNYKYFFGAPAANAATQTAQRLVNDTAPALRNAALCDRRTVVAVLVVLPRVVLAFAGTTGLAKYPVLWLAPALTLLQATLQLRAIAEHGAPPASIPSTWPQSEVREGPLLRG